MNVSIEGDENDAALTYWTVSLDMAFQYPLAKLDEFAFNLGASLPGDPSLVGFEVTSIAPNYSAQTLDKLAGYGNGQAQFLLTLEKEGAAGVNNAVPLTFTVRKTAGPFAIGDFLDAACTQGADPLGCNQMAAHIQAASDGGIAVGDYADGNAGVQSIATPEPASIVLLGSGAVAAALSRRRRRKNAA